MPLSTAPRFTRGAIRGALQPTGCGEYVRRQRVSRAVNQLCPIGGVVVDVGGGAGTLSTALRSDLRPRYTVVDIVREKYGRRIVADIARLPVVGSSVDVVCLSDVLEHVTDDVGVVTEALRILRLGAYLIVHVPSLREKPWGFVKRASEEAEEADQQEFPHVRDGYDAAGLASMLARVSGADLISVDPSFTALQSLVSDLDDYLWWRRLTLLRAATWSTIRAAPPGRVARPERSSSGLVGVLRRTL